MTEDTNPQPPGIPIRLRTVSDRKSAFQAYDEIRRTARSDGAVIIARMHDGSMQVLGNQMPLHEIGEALMAASYAVLRAEEKRTEIRPERHQEPYRRGQHNRNRPAPRSIKLDADGVMVPPEGENFISCGECHHPRWYCLNRNDDDSISRLACAHCGNEVIQHRIFRAEGTA